MSAVGAIGTTGTVGEMGAVNERGGLVSAVDGMGTTATVGVVGSRFVSTIWFTVWFFRAIGLIVCFLSTV